MMKHDFNRCHCDQWGRCLAHCDTCHCGEDGRWDPFTRRWIPEVESES